MLVCVRSFDLSNNFSRIGFYESNQFVFKQIKRMNDEEQLLQISGCLYFKIKCNNDIKDSFKFFYRELFLRLKYEFFL